MGPHPKRKIITLPQAPIAADRRPADGSQTGDPGASETSPIAAWKLKRAQALTWLGAMRGRVIQPPFEVTPIFMPGFEAGFCSLFAVTREAEGLVDLMTAIPVQNDEILFWAVPGFAAGHEELVGQYMTALLAAINARNLKPIGPPR